jgi:hypothetical protein
MKTKKQLEKEYAETAQEMTESAERYRKKLISLSEQMQKIKAKEVQNDTMDSNTGGIKGKTLSID